MPRAMRKTLIIKNHDVSSHVDIAQVDAQDIASCVECLFTKHRASRQLGKLNPIPVGRRPFEIVHLDHSGLFVTSARGNSFINNIILSIIEAEVLPLTHLRNFLIVMA